MNPILTTLLALILTLALGGCSGETHDSRDGQTQDGGVGGQFGGRADGN